MKLAVLLFCSFTFLIGTGQDSLSTDIVRKYTYSFTLDNNTASGPGWDSLKNEFRKSQFVVLGENHSSPLLSVLTAQLLNEAAKAGYKHFMLETGPVAAKKIPALYNADATLFTQRLHEFLSDFKLREGYPPSEFIAMKQDIPMLQAAVQNKFNITGLDKEYYSSIKYLVTELKKYCTIPALKSAYDNAMKQVEAFGNAYRSSEKYPYITNCKNDPAITLFLNQVSKQNADALFIISEMRKTFNIYGLYEAKQYVLSEDVRIANIKQNFGNCYYKNIGGNPQSFKALIKIGNAHSQRGLSYFDRYDIGNTVAELAYLNGTSSTHIQCMRRYRKNEEGAVMDFYNDGYEVYPNIITQTDSTKWVVIDLRPLRQLLVNRKIKINSKEERDLIKQNDIVLLIPVDGPHKSSQNY